MKFLNRIQCLFISFRLQRVNFSPKRSRTSSILFSWSINKKTNLFIYCSKKLNSLSRSRIKVRMDCSILSGVIFWISIIIIWQIAIWSLYSVWIYWQAWAITFLEVIIAWETLWIKLIHLSFKLKNNLV